MVVCFEAVNQFRPYLSYSALGLHFNAACFVHSFTPYVLYKKHTHIFTSTNIFKKHNTNRSACSINYEEYIHINNLESYKCMCHIDV